MRRFGTVLAVVFGIAVLSSFVALTPQNSATSPDGGPSVTIVNPLPLPVTGNVNASITNNSVNSVPITGKVGINGNVTVVNPLDASGNATPVITRDADNAARQPFVATCTLGVLPNSPRAACSNSSGSGEITVPDGKRLVIEYVSAELLLTAEKASVFRIQYASGGRFGWTASFAPQDTGPIAIGVETFVVSAPTRLYADAASKIDCSAMALTPQDFFQNEPGDCTISGYLVSP